MPGNMLPNFQPARFLALPSVSVPATLTPVTSQTSATDPITGHVYSFVAADGTTPEARQVGAYQDGTLFVVGGSGNPVRIGSITPVSDTVSTAAYTAPDNLDDEASTGTRIRVRHGTMVNPWQGVVAPGSAPMGFDSYYGTANQASAAPYQHDQNEDPGATGVPLVLEEGSVVKGESLLDEGSHTSSAVDKTRMLKMSCLTVVPEIPVADSFRPPIRGTDKRSYWTLADLDISGNRQIISGFQPFTTADIDIQTDLISYIQQSFAPYQEQARRWNPGARGGGVGIYGDDHYIVYARVFGAFHGDYTDEEITPIVKATVQAGIDIYGLLADGSYYFPWQAHHAGRKGICFMAGLLLGNQDILDQCDADLHPEHFGVDDAYTGYVTADMVDKQPRFYKGAYQYKWETEQIGIPEWSVVFSEGGATPLDVTTSDQVVDPDLARRSYQVLSFDNGAMYQCLWGMISDPTAQYYKPSYFDFADRYLGVRFGDQIDGVWDASSDNTGTNGHFTGNWWSINPTATTVANFKTMRDASSRTNYITSLIPEGLPKPQVSRAGANAYLDVDFNTNNFRMPQHKDVAITGYDLRWTAYAGGADTAASEDVEEYIGNFDWHVIEDITLPYQLSGVPRGLKVKVQLRMKNANGDGPWFDDRKRENYADDVTTYSILSGTQRYSTNFDVPDDAAFDQVPLNFGPPTSSPDTIVTGQTITGGDGIWYDGEGTITVSRKWQESSDGGTTWTDISPAETGTTLVAGAGQEGNRVRLAVQKTNDEGTSAWAFDSSGVPVSPPVAIELNGGGYESSAVSNPFEVGAGALGGKRLLILKSDRTGSVISNDGDIGAYSFGAAEELFVSNSGASVERTSVHQVLVPDGETASTIDFDYADSQTSISVYELTEEMVLTEATTNQSDGLTLTVDTVQGGAVFWLSRSSAWVNFDSSAVLEERSDNPVQNTSTRWSGAHALGTSDGTASVTHSNGAASNTIVLLVSVEPAP